MPYNFTRTLDRQEILEAQYAWGRKIMFSPFTSCIGVVGKQCMELIGAHLVMVGPDGGVIDDETANAAAALVATCSRVLIIGHVYMWEDNLGAIYHQLKGQIGHHKIKEVNTGDGTYGARLTWCRANRFEYWDGGRWRKV